MSMGDFVAYLIKNLVEQPGVVDVSVQEDEQITLVQIRVGAGDVARVVGRKGKTIQALRTIVTNIGSRFGRKVRLEVLQPEVTAL